MLTRDPIIVDADAIGEAKTYVRVDGAGEDALIATLLASAVAACEDATGTMLWRRTCTAMLPPAGDWTRLGPSPVTAITGVDAVAGDGSATPLPASAYDIDIDAEAQGRVRVRAPLAVNRIRVTFMAGAAAGWTGIDATLRQGIIRLVAHRHLHREDDEGAGLPAAVAALWAPRRRMRLQ